MNSPPESQPSNHLPEELAVDSSGNPHPRLRLHREFQSSHLPDARDLVVYLPPGYDDEPERTYPVLYMQDGQNLFDPRTSFIPGRTWEMREQADECIEAGEVEPLIIAGIYNTGERRIAEYTHERDWERGGGEADRYGRLLTEDLMPWIARTYRVRTDRASTALGGSSLGGLVTLYLGLRLAHRFSRLAVMSPSVWWNNKSILGYIDERAPQIRERPKLWLDVGEKEGHRTLRDVETLARRLAANGWVPRQSLHFERVPDGSHDESSWAQRVKPMLRFLFRA